MIPNNRAFRIVAAGAAAALLALSSPAVAAGVHTGKVSLPLSSWGHARQQIVSITMSTTTEFTAPDQVTAGWVTFRVSSGDADYHALEVARPNPGHTVDDVINDLQMGLGTDPATEALGARQLVRDGTLMGGVVPSVYGPMDATLPLTPGTYYLFDFAEFGLPTPPTVHTLRVVGHMNWSGMPAFDSVVGMYIDANDMPAFAAPTDFSATGNVLIYGQGDELHEATFRPVKPGTTDQYISDYYTALDAGLPHGPSPWTGPQKGFNAMSPGQFAVFHLNLPPGPYALICYVPSDETGLPHAHMGMHQVVTLN
jgi:hypothetical protein